MSEHDTTTVTEDPDLLSDEELDAVAGGIGPQGQNMRNMRNMNPGANPGGNVNSRGIIIENHGMIIEDNLPTP